MIYNAIMTLEVWVDIVLCLMVWGVCGTSDNESQESGSLGYAIQERIIAVVCDAVEFPEIFSEQVNK